MNFKTCRHGVMWVVFGLCIATFASAQQGSNTRATEDMKSFVARFEEADTLFNQKKYAEAAVALSASHELYQRADRRDSDSGRMNITIQPGKFSALRYFGYGFGSNASLTEAPTGAVDGSADGLHSAMLGMWQDAAILAGAKMFPRAGAFSDPSMVEMTEENLDSVVSSLYGPVSTFKLPVPDEEWRDVMLWSRRAKLIVEFALEKYPEWKTGTREWSQDNNKLQHSGNEALADIKAKLSEAEPEYAKLRSDFMNAAPKRAKEWLEIICGNLDGAIAGAKKNGWVDWVLARDLFITKDFLSEKRKNLALLYTQEGKQMPDDALKPIEERVASLKSAMNDGAAKWKTPADKVQNATIENKVASSVKARFQGATVIKTAMDSNEWIIAKNDIGIPEHRSIGVLTLVKIPGQTHAWLIFSYLRQTYAGGGTYSSSGTVQSPSNIRFHGSN